MEPEDILLQNLYNEDSIFKFVPTDIGEILYCDTTNPRRVPDNEKVIHKKVFWAISIPLILIFFCWYYFDSLPRFAAIVSVVMVVVSLCCIKKIYTFKGTDYFVGSEGATQIKFENSRDNITENTEWHFCDIFELFTGEKKVYADDGYLKTNYFFIIYTLNKNGNREILWELKSSHNQENTDKYYKDKRYRFWKTMEKAWSKYKLAQLIETLRKKEPVGFSIYEEGTFRDNYLVFQNEQLTVGETVYEKSKIKKYKIKDDKLVIEHANYSSSLFGLIREGEKDIIKLKSIGNRDLFLTLFKSFVSA